MKHFRVFNPEHDLALANGDKHFIAPKNIRDMARDLAPLMEIIECDHSLVWGWDSAVVTQLLRGGIAAEELPAEEALAALRTYSERKTAHRVLRAFRSDSPDGPYIGESVIIHDTSKIIPYAAQHEHIVLKDPLSSSGKGLRHVTQVDGLGKTEAWANALIRRHGYLTAEPYYTKVQDFAMEFLVIEGECRFIGYSLFNTNHHGRYEESILMEDEKIEAYLSRYVPCAALHELQSWIANHYRHIVPEVWDTTLFPLYFGIDMMVVELGATDKSHFIHPCVEINLRLNMGIIAHEVCRRRLALGTEGTFHVVAFPTEETLSAFHIEQCQKYPLVCQERRLVSGYYPLTPIGAHTRHLAYVTCRPDSEHYNS